MSGNRIGVVAGTAGGVLALAVSLGLAVSLPFRDVGYNALNLFTIVVASVAGVAAIVGSRREDGWRLAAGTVLLFIAMAPTIFGWVVLLYLPALIALLVASVSFITSTPRLPAD